MTDLQIAITMQQIEKLTLEKGDQHHIISLQNTIDSAMASKANTFNSSSKAMQERSKKSLEDVRGEIKNLNIQKS